MGLWHVALFGVQIVSVFIESIATYACGWVFS